MLGCVHTIDIGRDDTRLGAILIPPMELKLAGSVTVCVADEDASEFGTK